MSLTYQDFAYVYEKYLSRPYQEKQQVVLSVGGKSYVRPNHGLVHVASKVVYFHHVIRYVAAYAINDSFKKYCQALSASDNVEKLILEIILLFSITGRESEDSFHDHPQKYLSYKEKSIENCKRYLRDRHPALHLTSAQIEEYGESIWLMGGVKFESDRQKKRIPQIVRFRQILLGFSHCLDLMRCFSGEDFCAELKDYDGYVVHSPEQFLALTNLVELVETVKIASGDALRCRKIKGYQFENVEMDYRDPYYDLAENPEFCFNEIYQPYKKIILLKTPQDEHVVNYKPILIKIIPDYYYGPQHTWGYFLDNYFCKRRDTLRSEERLGSWTSRLSKPNGQTERHYEFFERSKRISLFTTYQKKFLTKPLSFTYASQTYKPVHCFHDILSGVGVGIKLKHGYIQRMMLGDLNSYAHPYDGMSEQEVKARVIESGSYFESLAALESAGIQNPALTNEVMARIQASPEGMTILVFNNVYPCRLLAQARAWDLKNNIAKQYGIDCQVNIQFYPSMKAYTISEQEEDWLQASSLNKSILEFLKNKKMPFDFQSKLQVFMNLLKFSLLAQHDFINLLSQTDKISLFKRICSDLRWFSRGASLLLDHFSLDSGCDSLVKKMLHHLIPFTDLKQLYEMMQGLSEAQYEFVMPYLKYNLDAQSKLSVVDDFSVFLKIVNISRCILVLRTLKSHLLSMIKNVDSLNNILDNISLQKKSLLLQALHGEIHLLDMNSYSFLSLFKILAKVSSHHFYLQDILLQCSFDCIDPILILGQLSLEERAIFFNFIQSRLSEFRWTSIHCVEVLNGFTLQECLIYFEPIISSFHFGKVPFLLEIFNQLSGFRQDLFFLFMESQLPNSSRYFFSDTRSFVGFTREDKEKKMIEKSKSAFINVLQALYHYPEEAKKIIMYYGEKLDRLSRSEISRLLNNNNLHSEIREFIQSLRDEKSLFCIKRLMKF